MAEHQAAELHDKTQSLVSEICAMRTQFDLFRFMRRVTDTFGMRAFMVLNLPSDTASQIAESSVITNWPAEMLSAYDKEGLLTTSPILARLRETTAPFRYDLDGDKTKTAEAADADPSCVHVVRPPHVAALFTRFGMQRGAYFPVHDRFGTRGAISFAGDRPPLSDAEMQSLAFVVMHVYDKLAQIRSQDVRISDQLTAREVDCLIWTAAGKTSVEIAEILSLSEHTVNHYLNRATKKLDTVNRTQAVVKALRLGIIK